MVTLRASIRRKYAPLLLAAVVGSLATLAPAATLTYTGTSASSPNGVWDVNTTANFNGSVFNDGDSVSFPDTTPANRVAQTVTIAPGGVAPASITRFDRRSGKLTEPSPAEQSTDPVQSPTPAAEHSICKTPTPLVAACFYRTAR